MSQRTRLFCTTDLPPSQCSCRYHTPTWGETPELPVEDRRTSDRSCSLDSLSWAMGVCVVPAELAKRIEQQPLVLHPLDHKEVKDALHKAGGLLKRIHPRRGDTFPLSLFTGQKAGMFLVGYTGVNATGGQVSHYIAIDCQRRVAFCNENGVYPFNLAESHQSKKEKATSHKKLKQLLGVKDITCVYRVLIKVNETQRVSKRKR
jgi:hypothetical protein